MINAVSIPEYSEVRGIALKACGDDCKQSDLEATMVIIASWMIGTDVSAISAITRVPKEQVREYGERLRDNGIWKAGRCATDYSTLGEDSGMELVLDSFVARGLMERSVGEDGKSRYKMNNTGAAFVENKILPKLSDGTKDRFKNIVLKHFRKKGDGK